MRNDIPSSTPCAEGEADLLLRLRQCAAALPALQAGLDEAAYQAAGFDRGEPLVGLGPADAPVCFFGRDPGADELRLRRPFVGGAGRLLRAGLLPYVPAAAEGDEALLRAGDGFFWLNIVPYKPRNNVVWPAGVREAFRPLVRECLLERWQGEAVVTLGEHAFKWFAAGQDPATRAAFAQRWRQVLEPDAPPMPVLLAHAGVQRRFEIHPLPHPSGRNVRGRAAFPALLDVRLRQLLPALARPRSGVS